MSVAAFWSGVPPILGLAAIYLGRLGRPSRVATAAVVIGIVTVVGDIAAYATDVASRA